MPHANPQRVTVTAFAANNGRNGSPPTSQKTTVTFTDKGKAVRFIQQIANDHTGTITVCYYYAPDSLPATIVVVDPPPAPKPRLKLNFPDESATNLTTEVVSRYVMVDGNTGHIHITLPDDVTTHHYSLKFFDKDNHAVIEVPRLTAARLIMDKRNFQHKGQYKFTIRKDVTEFESGYITIY
ncbi:MAG: hypothetical protein EBZ77_15290 [Chitinophagia bacterium]|nr:hypothetical protein [Chitinophagia bacterium]